LAAAVWDEEICFQGEKTPESGDGDYWGGRQYQKGDVPHGVQRCKKRH